MPSPRDHSTEQFLLTPLKTLYGPLAEDKKPFFLDALKTWTDTDLREAFVHLRDNFAFSRHPTIADIQNARKAVQKEKPRSHNGSYAERPKFPWEERAEKIEAIVKSYLETFRCSALASRAFSEGWGEELMKWARAVVSIQAQMIHPGGAGIGYDGVALFGFDNRKSDPEHKHRFGQLMAECRQIASTGRVEVPPLPRWREDGLRASAACFREIAGAQNGIPTPPLHKEAINTPPPPPAQADAYI